MNKREEAKNWAVNRAQQILMHEGMDLAQSARNLDPKALRTKAMLLATAIAASLLEASAAK